MSEYKCIICNKEYKSYSSLWNHNKKFHKGDDAKNFKCKYCGNKFAHRQSKYNHEKNFCKKVSKKEDLILQQEIEKNKEININKEIELEKIKESKVNKKLELERIKESKEQLKLRIIERQNTTEPPKNCSQYIYLIEKYDLNTNEQIFKVGKSKRPIIDRMKEHCLTSKLIFVMEVDNCDESELKILNALNKNNKIIKRSEIGEEYFSCEKSKIIKNILMQQFIEID